MLSKRNLFRIKFVVAVCATFMVALVGYAFYHAEKKEILNTLSLDIDVLSDTIKQAFMHEMLGGEKGVRTQAFIDSVSRLTSIERVRIYNREGEIRFSTDQQEVGQRGSKDDPACQLCHAGEVKSGNLTVTFQNEAGTRVFRNVNPIRKEKECNRCHKSDKPLLGVLMVDYSMAGAMEIIEDFRWATLFLVLSIIMVFGILIFLNQVFDYFRIGR